MSDVQKLFNDNLVNENGQLVLKAAPKNENGRLVPQPGFELTDGSIETGEYCMYLNVCVPLDNFEIKLNTLIHSVKYINK